MPVLSGVRKADGPRAARLRSCFFFQLETRNSKLETRNAFCLCRVPTAECRFSQRLRGLGASFVPTAGCRFLACSLATVTTLVHRLSILEGSLSASRIRQNVIYGVVAPRQRLLAFGTNLFIISAPNNPPLFRCEAAFFVLALVK